MIYPKDSLPRKIGSAARGILDNTLNSDHWEFRCETGNDVGRDCTIELSEDGEFRNHKIEGQFKGKQTVSAINGTSYISFPFETKTISYALSAHSPFVLFLVDVTSKEVYYLCIQEYFQNHPNLLEKLNGEQKTINVHIPIQNKLSNGDAHLQELAKKCF